jgi:hypothetical protein
LTISHPTLLRLDLPTDSPTAAVRYVVLGTVLIEPLILTLGRLAEQEASARRFG